MKPGYQGRILEEGNGNSDQAPTLSKTPLSILELA
jgi:hypothetical protein